MNYSKGTPPIRRIPVQIKEKPAREGAEPRDSVAN